MKRIIGIIGTLLVALIIGAAPASADPAGIADRAGLFGARTGDVEAALTDFQARTGMTATVATANGIGGQDIRGYATTAGAVLGRDQGEAVVIGVDVQTRKVGVYTTPQAMARIPDAEVTRIVDTVITPPFRTGDYPQGVIDGLRALADVATGVAAPAATTTADPPVTAPAGAAPGDIGGPTITVYPGGVGGMPFPGQQGSWPTFGQTGWPGTPSVERNDGMGTAVGLFIGFVALVLVGGIVKAIVSSANSVSDTPALRTQLSGLIDEEPEWSTWSNRQRYNHARRHTSIGRGTWNAIYPQWRVHEDRSSSSSSSFGGFSGGGVSSSSFSSDSSSSSSSSGGFSGGGGSSGSF
ncbi:TPM domain-containing protein [Tsukamurella strandjordii]|uniref:TPM domain-containing protein n=1 Tax=Tsukamurella strandjordii TaxID=147577 RepID=A0AA90NGT2_9ACTN|nr:TPM domain-containing protein [Tsukamurella strandjordii]MDP0400107.1 TPM domain-containing protein [Tsukamurella strandjordii]